MGMARLGNSARSHGNPVIVAKKAAKPPRMKARKAVIAAGADTLKDAP
jgi:hypothetical protein